MPNMTGTTKAMLISTIGGTVLTVAAVLALLLFVSVTGHHSKPAPKPNALCTATSINSMFNYYAGQLQTENNSTLTTPAEEIATLAQIKAITGGRLTACAGQLSATETSELQAINTTVTNDLNNL